MLELKQTTQTGHKHRGDGNSVIAPRLRGGSPAETEVTTTPIEFHRKSSYVMNGIYSTRQSAVNQETELDRGSLLLSSSYELAHCHSFRSRKQE